MRTDTPHKKTVPFSLQPSWLSVALDGAHPRPGPKTQKTTGFNMFQVIQTPPLIPCFIPVTRDFQHSVTSLFSVKKHWRNVRFCQVREPGASDSQPVVNSPVFSQFPREFLPLLFHCYQRKNIRFSQVFQGSQHGPKTYRNYHLFPFPSRLSGKPDQQAVPGFLRFSFAVTPLLAAVNRSL